MSWYEEIQRIIDYAEEHTMSLAHLESIMAGRSKESPGEDAGHVLEADNGLRIVYTIEEQPIGWCRHASMSFNLTGEIPKDQCNAILADLGFDSDIPVLSYLESGHLPEGQQTLSPNFIQKIPEHDDYWLRAQARLRKTSKLYN